jgi:DNA polymerase III alpha subunit
MNTNKYGAVILNPEEIFENIYSGKIINFNNVFTDQETSNKFNQSLNINKDDFSTLEVFKEPTESIESIDRANQCKWFMPENYCPDLIETLYAMCKTTEQRDRVDQELTLFIQHGMFDLLFYLKYLVDTMRAQKIVWGVGRGSSVASYCLYIIGVHKIDSIKYNLDIKEFLK